MYNKTLINVLLKVLGWATVVCAVIFFISGFFNATFKDQPVAAQVGFWIGYEISGLLMISFVYALLGVLYRLNNK